MHVEKKRIFIGNLPLTTDEDELKKNFENYGEVLSVEVKQRHESSRFAFVDLNINPNKLNACFYGLKQRDWKGHNVTLELARESFLSRLQREREQLQQPPPPPPHTPAAEQSDDSSEGESSHKGMMQMFQGTKRSLVEPPATNSDVLHRLESFSDTWRDDNVPSRGSRKRSQNDSFAAETPSKSLKIYAPKPANSSKTSEKLLVREEKCTLSEQRRLKSLAEKKRIFNEQKKLIQSALASVDGKQTLNKKIVFDTDDSDGDTHEPVGGAELRGTAKAALFDDDSADENNLNINHHFEGEKGRKLLELQSRYGNDERFKLDERFRDGDEQPQNEQLSEQEEDERIQNLKILGSVLGREIPIDEKKKHKHASKPMLRFDPTRPDHMKYEIKKSANATVANGTAKKKKKNAIEVKLQPSVKVSKDKFYKVSESLKEIFQKTDGNDSFSLRKMFGSDDDEVKEDSDSNLNDVKEDSQGSKNFRSQNPFKYDSSDQEDGNDGSKEPRKLPSVSRESSKSEVHLIQGNTFFFLPDDLRLREGVDFFNQKRSNTKRNEHFAEYRRNLKRWAKMKVKNNKHVAPKRTRTVNKKHIP